MPVILNTSFNKQEPIVTRPQEAISCFLRTEMDAVVIGDFYCVDRNSHAVGVPPTLSKCRKPIAAAENKVGARRRRYTYREYVGRVV